MQQPVACLVEAWLHFVLYNVYKGVPRGQVFLFIFFFSKWGGHALATRLSLIFVGEL